MIPLMPKRRDVGSGTGGRMTQKEGKERKHRTTRGGKSEQST